MWRRFFAVVFCVSAVGCGVRKRVNLIVPNQCIRLNAESFTRPCEQRSDGKLVCDHVVVTATCVQRGQ
jgi:hypothetical protein